MEALFDMYADTNGVVDDGGGEMAARRGRSSGMVPVVLSVDEVSERRTRTAASAGRDLFLLKVNSFFGCARKCKNGLPAQSAQIINPNRSVKPIGAFSQFR